MSSLAADIADALKTDMDGQTWPVVLTTAREYLVSISRTDLGATKRASIFPYTHATERGSGRGNVTREHGIAIVLRAQVDPADNSDVDELVETLEDIADRYSLTTLNAAVPQGVEMILSNQLYDVDRLADSRVFQGGIVITYTTRN
jgi:hypothetical protein